MIKEFVIYFLAAVCEISGCYTFWAVFKLNKPYQYIIFGIVLLITFAFLLTRIGLEFAGRAYAIYGGIYIISSLLWLFFVDKQPFNKWDIIGAIIIFFGIFIILYGNLIRKS